MTLEELSIIISVSTEEALQQLDKFSEKLEKFSEDQQKETKKAFDEKPVTDFGKIAKVTLDSFANSAKDATKDVVKSLKEGEDGVVSLSGVMKGLLGSAGSILTGGLAGLAVEVIGWIPALVESAISAGERAREEEKRQEEQRKQSVVDAATIEQEKLDRLRELRKRYNELAQKDSRTVEESAELSRIRRELAESYNIEGAAIAFAADERERLNTAMAQQEENIMNTLYQKQNDTTWMYIKDAREAYEKNSSLLELLDEAKQKIAQKEGLGTLDAYTVDINWKFTEAEIPDSFDILFEETAQTMTQELAAAGEQTRITVNDVLNRMMSDSQNEMASFFTDWIPSHLQQTMTELEFDNILVPAELKDGMKNALIEAFDFTKYGSFPEVEAAIRAAVTGMGDALRDPKTMDALNMLQGANADASLGIFDIENADAVAAAWEAVLGDDSLLMKAMGVFMDTTSAEGKHAARGTLAQYLGLEGLSDTAELAVSSLDATSASANSTADAADGTTTSLENTTAAADGTTTALGGTAAAADGTTTALGGTTTGLEEQADAAADNADALADLEKEFDWTNATTEEAETQAKKLISASKALDTQYKTLTKDAATLEKGQAAMNKAKDDASSLSAQEQQDLQAVRKLVNYYGDDWAVLGGLIDQNAKGIQTQLGVCKQQSDLVAAGLLNVMRNSNIHGSIKIEAASAFGVINGILGGITAVWNALFRKDDPPETYGGGGGKKDDPKRAAEEAARAAEEARRERIQKDYDEIAHRRHMNEITLEEELSMLAAIRENHKLNAEEIMEWEEKIFDLKKELRDRDTESLDALNDGVIEALTNRYEAMRDAELERLDASREAWEKWRDDSVKAVEDQIAALDKLADTEDREKKDAEELRKIEKLRQQVNFEQDEYNRMKLQQQLDAALESREERLRKLALQDQKDALREEIDKINEKADGQLGAIDQEQEKLETAYDERLKAAALQAEAERMIMQKDQMEMLALLRDFAPEYDAIGKSMGERLLDGFTQKIATGAAGWFETFNGWISQLQEQTAQVALAGVDPLYDSYAKQANAAKGAVTVNQSVSFNEPVLLGFYTDDVDCGLLVVVCGCGYGYVGFADADTKADADAKADGDTKADADTKAGADTKLMVMLILIPMLIIV